MPWKFALLYASLGDRQRALGFLEEAYDHREPSMVFLNVHVAFDPLHSERRFQDLLRRMNFPQ